MPPIPNPQSNERQRDFITRCYKEIKDEYDRAQSFAICYGKWKEKENMSKNKKKK
jgi:hypothetical protein